MIGLFRLAAYAAAVGVAGMAQVQAQENSVKIGVLTDMSSLYADLSGPGAVAAVKMAVADFGGSVLGKKIEVISADHQNKPDVASAIARQWFDQGVDMITDLTTSSVALAVQEVARDKNKVILVNGAASSDLTGKNCSPTSVHWTVRHYGACQRHRFGGGQGGRQDLVLHHCRLRVRPCPRA